MYNLILNYLNFFADVVSTNFGRQLHCILITNDNDSLAHLLDSTGYGVFSKVRYTLMCACLVMLTLIHPRIIITFTL